MSDELPKGWDSAALDVLCDRIRGVSYSRGEASTEPKKGLMPILRANNIDDDRLVFEDLVWVPLARISDTQRIRSGDVVIAMSSGSKSVVGKTAQAMADWEGAFGAFCGVLRPTSEMDCRYFGLFLRTREYRQAISELAAGTNINNLKAEHFSEITVPVAPLPEQKRIVAKLEKVLSRVDACKERLAKIPALLKRFRQSVLAAACSGRLTADWREENRAAVEAASLLDSFGASTLEDIEEEVPEKWCWGRFGDLVTNHDGARIPIKQSDRDKRSGPYPYYGAFGIIDDIDEFLYDGEFLLLAEDGKNLESRLRPISLVARGRFWVNNHAHVLQSKGGIPLLFLNIWLNSPSLDLSPFLTGIDQVKLNRAAMDRIPVPVAPLAEQHEIVRRVEELFKLADQIEARFTKANAYVEKLTQSVLAKAFRGELVPQDPNDEPASALLERIKARKSAPPTEGKTTRGRRRKG